MQERKGQRKRAFFFCALRLLRRSPAAAPGFAKERLAALATDPATGTPEEFAAYIKQEIVKWAEVVRKAGLKAE